MTTIQDKQKNLIHNLTASMAPYIDRHQLLRMIDFQKKLTNPVFDRTNLEQEELKLLNSTDMYEKAWELECQIRRLPEDTDMDNEYQQKSDNFYDKLGEVETEVDAVKEKFKQEETSNLLQQGKDNNRLWVALTKDCGFQEEDLDTLFKFALMQYNSGDYEECGSHLYLYRLIAPYEHNKHLSSVWGSLANDIQLLGINDDNNDADEEESEKLFDSAVKLLDQLKETIDKQDGNYLKTLQLRAWLLHSALFIYFSKEARSGNQEEKGGNKSTEYLITLCLNNITNDKEDNHYKNAIETLCPWLLRYLAVILVTSKNVEKKNYRLKKLVDVIEQESYNYSDPITDFLLCLNKQYDFENAQEHLKNAREVLRSDYFLHPYVDQFIEKGRILIFEMYCRIHKKIKVETIADKLDMTQEDAELWIVELIRNARLHAKIDGENGNIIMGSDPVMPYQQIIQKTQNLSISTSFMIKSLDKKLKSQSERNSIPSWAKHGKDRKNFE